MSTYYLNAKAPLVIGKFATLKPGANELDKAAFESVKKTRIGKHLLDAGLLSTTERDPNNVYKIPTPKEPDEFAAKSGSKSAKPEGKKAGSAMTPDGSVVVDGLPG